jgi:hypothetical protein
MERSKLIYTLAFTHVMEHPFFDDICQQPIDQKITVKGWCKLKLLELYCFCTNNFTIKTFFVVITINSLYERNLNS